MQPSCPSEDCEQYCAAHNPTICTHQHPYVDGLSIPCRGNCGISDIQNCHTHKFSIDEQVNLRTSHNPNMYLTFPANSVNSAILSDHFDNRIAGEAFAKRHFYDNLYGSEVNYGFICNWCAGNNNYGEKSGALMRCRQCGRLDYSETKAHVADASQFPMA